MDDTLDTLDTSVDTYALDDATEIEEALDTEQIPALDATELDITALTVITGGMRWQELRRSTNVEDRRSPRAIARDNQWWERQHAVPLPPRRPEGI